MADQHHRGREPWDLRPIIARVGANDDDENREIENEQFREHPGLGGPAAPIESQQLYGELGTQSGILAAGTNLL